jgi:glyoxylase-like metal-dependent hydrolase (beta-lactamase superfamily II)
VKVHHVNCGTMRPPGLKGHLVCHILIIETGNGLVLVDSGFGLADAATRGRRFGPARHLVRPACSIDETAVRRIESLGFGRDDVRHIVLTHFDADHTGGLVDFPDAQVHLTALEASAAVHPKTFVEKQRYPACQRDHDPKLVSHSPRESEAWQGFPAAKELTEIAPGIVLIALPGHTRGHAAVAVDAGDHWVLHAGDAFYHRGELGDQAKTPFVLTAMERAVAHNWRQVKDNHRRLGELWAAPDPKLLLVNAHDPELLTRAQNR